MVDFPKPLKNLWNDWDVRVFVLTSLLLQILLIAFAPFRKRSAKKSLALFMWSTYLLADWVAAFALGLLCNGQGKSDCESTSSRLQTAGGSRMFKTTAFAAGNGHSSSREYNDKLLAFWAPFLLLHLGGPDNITAFAMEDNELWPRHFLGLIFEVGAAVYVFLLSIPKNKLIVPTLLMFLAGIIKYGERTYALYRASFDGFCESMLKEPDPGPNYATLMEEYGSKLDSNVPTVITISEEPKEREKDKNEGAQEGSYPGEQQPDDEGEVRRMQKAFKFYDMFKGLVVEFIFSFQERNEGRTAFLSDNIKAEEAFRVVEYELSFVFEVLFTKSVVVHGLYGYVLRAICSCSIVAAFLSFFFLSKNQKFSPPDEAITYALLGGAICLDVTAFFMLLLSDWTIVKLPKIRFGKLVSNFLVKVRPRNRWSKTVTQHNLMNCCIPPDKSFTKRVGDRHTIFGKLDEILHVQKLFRWMDVGTQLFDEMKYTWREDVAGSLEAFIFKELRRRAEGNTDLKETRHRCSCRGDWALNERGYNRQLGYSVEVEFDESLLMWHIATDLCYCTEEDTGKEEGQGEGESDDQRKEEGQGKGKSDDQGVRKKEEPNCIPINASMHRRFCKLLSDYLVYLLVMRPLMMPSSTVIGKIRYRETCAEAKDFFRQRRLKVEGSKRKYLSLPASKLTWRAEEMQRVGCSHLLSVNTSVKPVHVKGSKSKSVLFDACILAKDLKKLKLPKRWEIMCEVWTEMLIYAAGRCPGIAHAQMLSKGGELLTFVWFLVTHMGLGDQYRIEAGHPRAKLTVKK